MDPSNFRVWLDNKDPEKHIAIAILISRGACQIIKRWASENSMADSSAAVDLLPQILMDLVEDASDEHFERLDIFDHEVSSIFSAIHGMPHPEAPTYRGVDAFQSIAAETALTCNQSAAHAAQAISNIFAVAGGYGYAMHYENNDKHSIADVKKECSRWIVAAIAQLAKATNVEFSDLARKAELAELTDGYAG